MFVQVVTTITTSIDIETFETTHAAEVVPDDGLPHSVAVAAAKAACRNTLKALEEQS